MSKRTAAIITTVILALVAVGAGEFLSKDNVGEKALSLTLSQSFSSEEREIVAFDTSRIWSRGPTGNAAENATHHFKKHGHEFGFKAEQDYVAAAVRFTTDPTPEGVLKNIQRDGDIAYYNPKTAEYAVKSKKGFIRTYFKLSPKIRGFQSNTDYFNAQAQVGENPPANDNHQR